METTGDISERGSVQISQLHCFRKRQKRKISSELLSENKILNVTTQYTSKNETTETQK